MSDVITYEPSASLKIKRLTSLLREGFIRLPDPCHTFSSGCTPNSSTGDPPCEEKQVYDAIREAVKGVSQ